jgi:hypothetical protein
MTSAGAETLVQFGVPVVPATERLGGQALWTGCEQR